MMGNSDTQIRSRANANAAGSGAGDAPVAYNLERLIFLIVDDNRHMRNLIKAILHSFTVRNVIEAEDGADAFREMRTATVDIIICDWAMEPLDGIDFVRLVRTGKDSPNPFVPVIMLTGHTEMNRVVEARDVGVNEFMAKPISAKGLYARIRSIIEHPRQFIRTSRYTGPDRRRRRRKGYEEPGRRKTDQAAAQLSQTEVEALLRPSA